MLVAGIDASTKATGVSIMNDGELIYYKLISINSKDVPDAYERIKKMFVQICEILDKYDIDTMIKGKSAIMTKYLYILQKNPRDLKPKEKDIQDVLEMALEMTARGFTFSNVSITKSDATKFIVDTENNALIPPFLVIDGLGDAAAQSIIEARNERPFISKQDLMSRTQISQTHFQIFDQMGILDDMANEEQLTLSLF